MEQFKQIYRILSTLHTTMDLKEWDSKIAFSGGAGSQSSDVVEDYDHAS